MTLHILTALKWQEYGLNPLEYWKLKEIQEKTNIIKAGDTVLDIGSSAGGFLLFASEIASLVHGIEIQPRVPNRARKNRT